jgi:hypothetical protein
MLTGYTFETIDREQLSLQYTMQTGNHPFLYAISSNVQFMWNPSLMGSKYLYLIHSAFARYSNAVLSSFNTGFRVQITEQLVLT